MVEMASRVLNDMKLARTQSIAIVVAAVMVFGLPSVISLRVFENQDWVWGLGLLVSGFLIAMLVVQHGLRTFTSRLTNNKKTRTFLLFFYGFALKYFVPIGFLLMFSWWMYQSAVYYDSDQWWNPLRVNSVGTCLFQWGLALFLLKLFNGMLGTKSIARNVNLDTT